MRLFVTRFLIALNMGCVVFNIVAFVALDGTGLNLLIGIFNLGTAILLFCNYKPTDADKIRAGIE